MALPSFQSVVMTSHFYAPIATSIVAETVYETILCDPNMRIAMVDAIRADRPAINAVSKQIENYYNSLPTPDINLADDQVKQCFGRLVAVVVEPFGYLPKKTQAKGKLDNNNHYFVTGKKYQLTGKPSEKIIRTIISIP